MKEKLLQCQVVSLKSLLFELVLVLSALVNVIRIRLVQHLPNACLTVLSLWLVLLFTFNLSADICKTISIDISTSIIKTNELIDEQLVVFLCLGSFFLKLQCLVISREQKCHVGFHPYVIIIE